MVLASIVEAKAIARSSRRPRPLRKVGRDILSAMPVCALYKHVQAGSHAGAYEKLVDKLSCYPRTR